MSQTYPAGAVRPGTERAVQFARAGGTRSGQVRAARAAERRRREAVELIATEPQALTEDQRATLVAALRAS